MIQIPIPNYISFYNSNIKVGDNINLRFSNYNSNADYLDTDGSQLFSYGPALKVVAKCGGGNTLTLSNVRHLTIGTNDNPTAENVSLPTKRMARPPKKAYLPAEMP